MSFREIKDEVRLVLEEALKSLDYPLVEFNVDEPPKKELGDLYSNIAFLLSKRLKIKPRDIANDIVNVIRKPDIIAKIEAHPAGYINFFIDNLKFANKIIEQINYRYRINPIDLGKKARVVIEHTSVNPNKALHIGHVRNLVIGDTLYRMLKFTNHDVYVLNYIDDSGLQVADIIVGFYFLKMPLDTNKKFDHYCGDEVYVKVNKLYDEDPSLLDKRREVLKAMEDYDSELAKFAREITDRVLREQLKTCWRLKARYDCLNFESQIIATKLWDKIKAILIEKGIAKIDDDPNSKYYKCLVVKAGIEGEEKVLERSDGTATYIAKDIPYAAWKVGLIEDPFAYEEYKEQFDGTILYKTVLDGKKDLTFANADKAITVIDVRQSRLQKIISKILEELNSNKPYIHLGYEVVALSADTAKQLGIDIKDKRFVHMKGREGTYINADTMLDKLHYKAYEEAKSRNPDLKDHDLHYIAENIAIAAIRYNMLKQDLDKPITFDINETLRLQGDTGPYI
ncbi:MAG: arginine--tRNA ligase, partial [Candidatus Nitrosothermus koennekii]